MKNLALTAIALSSATLMYAQTLCGTAGENGSITLTAPAGKVFTSVVFASYGTPTGSCGSFALGGCHASNSSSVVGAAFLNNNSGTIGANNGVFGDPCGGTVKQLYIELAYGNPLPLKLTSFTYNWNRSGGFLTWTTEDEINTSRVQIEFSSTGSGFRDLASYKTFNTPGVHRYQHAISISGYYRLKLVDIDGSYTYSAILQVKGDDLSASLRSNIVTGVLEVDGLSTGDAVSVASANGVVLKQFVARSGYNSFDLSLLPTGLYLLHVGKESFRFVKR